MAKEFLYTFPNQMFTVGQQLAFNFKDMKLLSLVVREIEGMVFFIQNILRKHRAHLLFNQIFFFLSIIEFLIFFSVINVNSLKQGNEAKPRKGKLGKLTPNTIVQFERAENSALNLIGKAKGYLLCFYLVF